MLDEAFARLIAAGAAAERGGLLALPRPDAERARAREEARAGAARSPRRCAGAGSTPPDAAARRARSPAKRALDRLVREGVIVRAHDRVQKREILFHRDAIPAAQRRLAPLLAQPPGLLVSEVGAALGISRKYSVPLLEHLDRDPASPAGSGPPDARPAGSSGVGRGHGGDWGLVAPLVFKTSGPPTAGGGFDSHPPPPRYPELS